MTTHDSTNMPKLSGAQHLRKLRGKQLVLKPGRNRRYHVPETSARTITALLTLRENRPSLTALSTRAAAGDCPTLLRDQYAYQPAVSAGSSPRSFNGPLASSRSAPSAAGT